MTLSRLIMAFQSGFTPWLGSPQTIDYGFTFGSALNFLRPLNQPTYLRKMSTETHRLAL